MREYVSGIGRREQEGGGVGDEADNPGCHLDQGGSKIGLYRGSKLDLF